MNGRALAILLLLSGGITARICLTGEYVRYVKPGLLPFLAAAAVALVAIGAATLWYEFAPDQRVGRHSAHRPGPGQETLLDHGALHDDGVLHGRGHEPGVAWLLLVPVLALALLAPPALGSDAAVHSGTALAAPTGDFPPLPEGDPAPLTLTDYASRAVFDDGRSIGDRRVRLTGFVIRGAQGELFVTRMVLSCCAADARPIKVGLSGDVPGDLPSDAWVEVIGTYTPHQVVDEINSGIIPFIQASSVTRIAPPTDPYGS
jgi:uncharacterized repeat protein (TIGR03943 family)